MELKIKTFKIKISKVEKEVVMISGHRYSGKTDYRITENGILRRPTSYEYQKIYKAVEIIRAGEL